MNWGGLIFDDHKWLNSWCPLTPAAFGTKKATRTPAPIESNHDNPWTGIQDK